MKSERQGKTRVNNEIKNSLLLKIITINYTILHRVILFLKDFFTLYLLCKQRILTYMETGEQVKLENSLN